MPKRWQRIVPAALALALALGGVVAWLPSPAYACDFDEPPPPDIALEDATAVFSGVVIEIAEQEGDPVDSYYAVRFEVERVWKDVEQAEIVVETHVDEATCGYPFEQDERYLVYAHGAPDELITALFHRTTHWEDADEDLAVLGDGTPIAEIETDGTTGTDEREGDAPIWLLLPMLFLVSLLAAVVILIRRTRVEADEDANH